MEKLIAWKNYITCLEVGRNVMIAKETNIKSGLF